MTGPAQSTNVIKLGIATQCPASMLTATTAMERAEHCVQSTAPGTALNLPAGLHRKQARHLSEGERAYCKECANQSVQATRASAEKRPAWQTCGTVTTHQRSCGAQSETESTVQVDAPLMTATLPSAQARQAVEPCDSA